MKFGYTPYAPNMCHHMFCLLRVIFSEGCGKVSRRWWETNHWEQPNHCESWAVECIQFFLEAPQGLESLPQRRYLGRPFWVWRGHDFLIFFLLSTCRFQYVDLPIQACTQRIRTIYWYVNIYWYIHIVTCATEWIKQNVSQSEKQSNISRSFKPT